MKICQIAPYGLNRMQRYVADLELPRKCSINANNISGNKPFGNLQNTDDYKKNYLWDSFNSRSLNTAVFFKGKTGMPHSRYKSSKYSCSYTQNSILDSKTEDTDLISLSFSDKKILPKIKDLSDERLKEITPFIFEMYYLVQKTNNTELLRDFDEMLCSYKKGEIDISVLTDKYSELKIKTLLADILEESDINYEYNQIKQILSSGSVTSSNLEMLMSLVKDKKIHPAVIQFFTRDCRLNANAEKDLDKLYDVYINNKNPKEEFIPDFTNAEEAVKNIETGDLCSIRGSRNIQIKMKDNTLKELFITPDTYFELFPPVERYIYTQGNNGDCYFISALDSIYSNPNTGYRVLECFNENDDGSIDLSLGGFKRTDGEVRKQNPDDFVLYDVYSYKDKEFKENGSNLSCTCEGLKLLEMIYEKNNEYNACQRILKYYEQLCEAEKSFLYSDIETINIGNKTGVTKNEIDIFLSLLREYIDKPEELHQRFISLEDTSFNFTMNSEEMLSVLYSISSNDGTESSDLPEKCGSEQIRLLKLILERNLKEVNGNQYKSLKEILPAECFVLLSGKELEGTYIYTNGGKSSSLFKLFGYKTDIINPQRFLDAFLLRNMLREPDFNDMYMLNASTSNKKIQNIFPGHSYSISVKDTETERIYMVRNPHNTANETVMTERELFDSFDKFTVAYIE